MIENVLLILERELGRKLQPNTDLSKIGMDSLEYIELVMTVEAELGKIPKTIKNLRTPKDIADALVLN
jgi:acyl carrier protein